MAPPEADSGIGSEEHQELVQRVKQIQRQGEDGKVQWHNFCDMNGNGSRDPMRHPCSFLRKFFEAMEKKEIPAVPVVLHDKPIPGPDMDEKEALAILAAKVKHGQRISAEWKQKWGAFCDQVNEGVRDPLKHSVEQLRRFFAEFAPKEGAGESSDALPLTIPDASSSRKSASKADPAACVERVKQLQRGSEAGKQQWGWYCDTYGGGVRDPERHPAEFLQQFLATYGGRGAGATPYGKAPHEQGYPPMYPPEALGYGAYGKPPHSAPPPTSPYEGYHMYPPDAYGGYGKAPHAGPPRSSPYEQGYPMYPPAYGAYPPAPGPPAYGYPHPYPYGYPGYGPPPYGAPYGMPAMPPRPGVPPPRPW